MKVTKYFTATGTNTEDLDKAVNSMIQKGYQPFGNAYDVEDGPICQTMVRVEEAAPVEAGAQVG